MSNCLTWMFGQNAFYLRATVYLVHSEYVAVLIEFVPSTEKVLFLIWSAVFGWTNFSVAFVAWWVELLLFGDN